MVSIAQLKLWFKKGLKPTELQFAAWLDSFWHKQDTIPAANVEGYQTILDKRITSANINETGHLIITLSDGSAFDAGLAAGLPGADGENAVTPHIGENKNWFIGSVDTGIKAEGIDGVTPHIGVNGNWYFETVDSGIKAQGVDGYTPVKGTDYFDGDNGKSAYELAVLGGFVGTEAEWLTSLHGTAGYTPQKGTDYDDGIDGKSAYELAVLAGFIGTAAEWLASLVGIKGDKGDTGNTGADGSVAQTSSATSSGILSLSANRFVVLTTTFTNAHTMSITPTVPTDFTRTNESGVLITTGASNPAITITPPAGVTFIWMDKVALTVTDWQMNKTYTMIFFWINSTLCQVYYSIKG